MAKGEPDPDMKMFTPVNRLKRIFQGDGRSANTLVAAAETRVDDLGDDLRAFVTGEVDELLKLAGASEEVLLSQTLGIAHRAIGIADVAGAAKMEAAGEVARGISAMLDTYHHTKLWRVDALRLHLSALLLVRGHTGSADSLSAMLGQLHAMRLTLGVSE